VLLVSPARYQHVSFPLLDYSNQQVLPSNFAQGYGVEWLRNTKERRIFAIDLQHCRLLNFTRATSTALSCVVCRILLQSCSSFYMLASTTIVPGRSGCSTSSNSGGGQCAASTSIFSRKIRPLSVARMLSSKHRLRTITEPTVEKLVCDPRPSYSYCLRR
jgi:hypothetical protein